MNGSHSPWPLFGDDIELARAWLRPQLEEPRLTLELGHLAISLGMTDGMDALLNDVSRALNPVWARQWRFRLARLNRQTNPYQTLVPPDLQKQGAARLSQHKRSGQTLGVSLNGGIGDHLEAISLLLPWAEKKQIRLKLLVSPERLQQLQPLLANSTWIEASDGGMTDSLPMMALRERVFAAEPQSAYKSWIQCPIGGSPTKLICCWRAEGSGQPFSAHSRSLPFHQVWAFYSQVQKLRPELKLVDITAWKPWEASAISKLDVSLRDPRQGNLQDLAELCRGQIVISIDTALAHLCAAMGQPAHLLLCRYPDERWQELLQPQHSYGQHLRVHCCSQFGRWDSALESLLGCISDSF